MTLFPIFKTLYPENSYGGQCIVFLHKLVNFKPIGDTIQSKVASVYWRGIMAKNLNGDFRIGDLVITREGRTTGHGAIISAIWGDDLQLTESNFYGDKKIHHGRLLNKFSSLIVGVIRSIPKYSMFIRRDDGQISLLTPEGKRWVLSALAWEKLGKPYAPTFKTDDYQQYPEAGVIRDIIL